MLENVLHNEASQMYNKINKCVNKFMENKY